MSRRNPLTPLQVASAVAVGGAVLAVALPAFYRNVHASRLIEPVSGLTQIGQSAVALAAVHHAFPTTAPFTPESPPRGTLREDPVGAWDHPTWVALGFAPTEPGVPHAFNFGFENRGKLFVAVAHGDLDGDGNLSTFEVRGTLDANAAVLDPGMYVASEFE